MLLIRELLYEEKKFDDFCKYSDDAIFNRLYKKLCPMCKKGKYILFFDEITNMFNDACFIFTLILIPNRPDFSVFKDYGNKIRDIKSIDLPSKVKYDDIVKCIVLCLFDIYLEQFTRREKIYVSIFSELNSHPQHEFFQKLHTASKSPCKVLKKDFFKPKTRIDISFWNFWMRKKGIQQPTVDEITQLYDEIKHLKDEIEHLRKERDELKRKAELAIENTPESAFNVQNGSKCFTNRQMGILMHAVSYFTEEKPVAKTTIGQVVEKISGYKATTINQNTRGEFRDSDKEAVAQAIEDKFPKLAAKVRKL